MSKTLIVLYNGQEGRYFAGVTPSQSVVTTNRREVAKKFTSLKEAKSRIEFLRNSGYQFSVTKIEGDAVV